VYESDNKYKIKKRRIYLKLGCNMEWEIARVLRILYVGIIVLYVASDGVVGEQDRWRHIRISLHRGMHHSLNPLAPDARLDKKFLLVSMEKNNVVSSMALKLGMIKKLFTEPALFCFTNVHKIMLRVLHDIAEIHRMVYHVQNGCGTLRTLRSCGGAAVRRKTIISVAKFFRSAFTHFPWLSPTFPYLMLFSTICQTWKISIWNSTNFQT